MKVYEIKPNGFCYGVQNSILLVEKLINDCKVNKPIYVLGQLVHNQFVLNKLKNNGVVVLDELPNEYCSGTIVSSAHGIPPKSEEILKNNSHTFIDATCNTVKNVHNLIKKYIAKGYLILYIGHSNHPEVTGVLGIDQSIILIDDTHPIIPNHLDTNKILLISQTTINIATFDTIAHCVKIKYPFAIIKNTICPYTIKRQLSILKHKMVDMIIVVGDKKSSNSNALVSLSLENGINSILINSVCDLENDILKEIKSVGVIGGTSTPKELVDEVVTFLKDYI